MIRQHDELCELVEAYADHELDLQSSIEFERHIASCERCGHVLAQIQMLKDALKGDQLYHHAPQALKASLASAIAKENDAHRQQTSRRKTVSMSWFSYGLSLASVAAVSLILTLQFSSPSVDTRFVDEVTASHVRSLMEGHLEDVVSTDQHTVKPWFAGRLDYSPPVTDFSSDGFPLAGGRLDYIGHRTVATLIYRHNKHIINVYVWPEQAATSTKSWSRDGFNLIRLNKSGMTYWIVSDLNAEELRDFSRLM